MRATASPLEVLNGVEGRGLALLLDRQAGAQQKSGHGRGSVEVPASVGKGLAVALIVVAVDPVSYTHLTLPTN